MNSDTQPLDYAAPQSPQPFKFGAWVRGFGIVTVLNGITTSALGTVGLDDHEQIIVGWFITGFGVTWALIGQVMHAVELRPAA